MARAGPRDSGNSVQWLCHTTKMNLESFKSIKKLQSEAFGQQYFKVTTKTPDFIYF